MDFFKSFAAATSEEEKAKRLRPDCEEDEKDADENGTANAGDNNNFESNKKAKTMNNNNNDNENGIISSNTLRKPAAEQQQQRKTVVVVEKDSEKNVSIKEENNNGERGGVKANTLGGHQVGHYANRDMHLRKQEEDGELQWKVIKNDENEQHSIWLIALKNIFSKQLPNMPKEYIVRLVFDPRHHSMLCLKNDQVIGGITYRPFWRQNMCEIAFCAISANEQVKGYGTRLMNHLKEYVKEEEDMTHLITFADNNAVGYFAKQGFTKDIVMEREKWVGYIKEYDGGTIMECALEAQISYVDFPKNIRAQRECVEAKVREMTTAHVVYPGLARFKDGGEFGKHRITDPLSMIKGLKEAKWKTPDPPRYRLVHPGCGDGYPTIENLHKFMRSIIAIVRTHPDSWPFMSAVNKEEVPDYYEVVKMPADIETLSERVESEIYYMTLEMFAADFKRMFENCRMYNSADTIYYKCANRLELFFDAKIAGGITFKVRDTGSYLNR